MVKRRNFIRFPRSSRNWGLALLLSLGALAVLAAAVSQQGSFLDFRNRAAALCGSRSADDCAPPCTWVPITNAVNCDNYSFSNCPSGCQRVGQEGPPQSCTTVQQQVWVECSAGNNAGANCDYNPGTGRWSGGYYKTVSTRECTQRPGNNQTGYCAGGIKTTTSGKCTLLGSTPAPGTQPAATTFEDYCSRSPNPAIPFTTSTSCPAIPLYQNPCIPAAKQTITKKYCDGRTDTTTQNCPIDQNNCDQYRKTFNNSDKCQTGVGCYVPQSNFCVFVGENNAGHICQADGKFTKATSNEDYVFMKKSDCEFTWGGCSTGNYCVKPGHPYTETGDVQNPRTYCCSDGGKWKPPIPSSIVQQGHDAELTFCQGSSPAPGTTPSQTPPEQARGCGVGNFITALQCARLGDNCELIDNHAECVEHTSPGVQIARPDQCGVVKRFMCGIQPDNTCSVCQ